MKIRAWTRGGRLAVFLADVLALKGENLNAIREGVHVALVDCRQIFRAQEVNRRMKDKARTLAKRFVALALSRKYSVGGWKDSKQVKGT